MCLQTTDWRIFWTTVASTQGIYFPWVQCTSSHSWLPSRLLTPRGFLHSEEETDSSSRYRKSVLFTSDTAEPTKSTELDLLWSILLWTTNRHAIFLIVHPILTVLCKHRPSETSEGDRIQHANSISPSHTQARLIWVMIRIAHNKALTVWRYESRDGWKITTECMRITQITTWWYITGPRQGENSPRHIVQERVPL